MNNNIILKRTVSLGLGRIISDSADTQGRKLNTFVISHKNIPGVAQISNQFGGVQGILTHSPGLTTNQIRSMRRLREELAAGLTLAVWRSQR